MATATAYTAEQLNYYRICFVTTDILAEGLRLIFKQEWDKRYKEWKDEPWNGTDFKNAESPRNQHRNAHLLATMVNGDRAEWDCTMLFYAILYSDSIGTGLNAVVRSRVNDLRRFRNEEFAHMTKGELSDPDFQTAMGRVNAAFQGLGLSTLQIQEVANQTTFPTEELRDVLNKVQDLKSELQEKDEQKQELEDKLQEKEDHLQGIQHQLHAKEEETHGLEKKLHQKEEENQILEDQLQKENAPFCILPPKPTHDILGRYGEEANITQQLKELKQANQNLSYLYISGNPGSGKSQLAGLVAKRFFDDAQGDLYATAFVMTLNAESIDTLLQSYFSFARQLNCPEYAVANIIQSKDMKTDEKIGHLKMLISAKLDSYTSWLLVADNVKNVSQMHKYLPELGDDKWARGQLLITTQDSASIGPSTSSFFQHTSIKKGMEPEDAISLLAMLSGIVDNDMGKVVAQALDFQPLALASAATYVKQLRQNKLTSKFGWNEYLEKLKRGQRVTTETILAETNPSYPKPMTEATTLAVKEIVACDKVIDHTFRFLSLCAPQPLSLEIMINYVLNVDEEIQNKEMIILRIQRCSLILLEKEDSEDSKDSGVYISVHQVVRDVIQILMKNYPESLQHKAVNGAVIVFNKFIDETLLENWQDADTVVQSKSIAPHLQTLNFSIENLIVSKEKISQIFETEMLKLGQTCQNHCDFHSAKRYFEYSLAIILEKKGKEDIYVANAYNHLGYVHQAEGDFEQAKEYYHCALKIFMKKLGRKDLHVATTCSNLGSVYEALGDFKQAKKYHRRDLTISLKRRGPEDPDVATTYSNLGSLYEALGDFKQAKEYHLLALKICLKNLGPEDGDVATIYSNLGSVYEALGDLEQAKEYHHLALRICLKKLGPEHPDVATIYNNLGSVYEALGDFKQAKEYHDRDLTISLKMLGPEHPDVATTYSHLGSLCKDFGDFEQAIEYHHRDLNISLKRLGSQHPDVATTYNNLGSVYEALGDFKQAKKYHHLALNIRLKKLGPDHPDVANTYTHLGSVHEASSDLEKAKEYHHLALNIRLEKLGSEHVDVAASYTHLGSVHEKLGDLEQAKEYHRRAFRIPRKNIGREDVNVPAACDNMDTVQQESVNLQQFTEGNNPSRAVCPPCCIIL